ncbi:hypothetical protein FOMPIDRAFT_117841 [Fomitopsis schrenkii]|uniref:Uncharacterized protein n=1 Tax=Fomitopsis schrenkii TaxID=2126942 RepID=S8FI20_FOMSC|nr:hypothetical protein FOMPIDRAFT_117841 [Fomitopsis schrenkii]
MTKHPGLRSEQDVRKAWIRHTEHLRDQYKELMKDPVARVTQERKRRQQERKRNLFEQRRRVAMYVLGELESHALGLVDALGVQGMSSDESDHESGQGQATYFIKKVPWRSAPLHTWLRELDSLHLWVRYQMAHTASAGSWPHFRVDGTRESKRNPVLGLPQNCYAPKMKLDQFRWNALKYMAKDIPLVHLDDVRKTAKEYDLGHRRLVSGRLNPEEDREKEEGVQTMDPNEMQWSNLFMTRHSFAIKICYIGRLQLSDSSKYVLLLHSMAGTTPENTFKLPAWWPSKTALLQSDQARNVWEEGGRLVKEVEQRVYAQLPPSDRPHSTDQSEGGTSAGVQIVDDAGTIATRQLLRDRIQQMNRLELEEWAFRLFEQVVAQDQDIDIVLRSFLKVMHEARKITVGDSRT